jgi:protein involved in polysaccharide export with SLBB domain
MIKRLRVGVVLLGWWVCGVVVALPRDVRAAIGGAASTTSAATILGAGDTLRVTVQELVSPGQEYATDVEVNELGYIRIQNVGGVRVAGLTTAEAEGKIGQAAVAGGFLFSKGRGSPGPQVSVRLLIRAAENAAALRMIGPGDTLGVKAYELMTPGVEYVTEARVNEIGDIKLYGVGKVHVADLTPTQAEDKIGQLAVAGGFLLPKSATNPGPQVFVRLLKKAEAGGIAGAGVLSKIGPVDTLRIQVFELVTPGLDYVTEAQVDEQGKIKIRNLDRMAVAGLTTTEIEDKIAEQAVSQGFLMPKGPGSPGPQVIVNLMKQAAPGERPATIRVGDGVRVEAWELVAPRQLYSATVVVNGQGEIQIEKVGTVRVGGLTPAQVEDKIIQMAVDGGFLPPKSNAHSAPMVNVTWIKKEAGAATTGSAPGGGDRRINK